MWMTVSVQNTGKYWRTHDDMKLTAYFVAKHENYKDFLI